MTQEQIEFMQKLQSDFTQAVEKGNELMEIANKQKEIIEGYEQREEILTKKSDLLEEALLHAFHALYTSHLTKTERNVLEAWAPDLKNEGQ